MTSVTSVTSAMNATGVARLPQRIAGPCAALAAGSAALGLLAVRDPHRSGSYGHCPFLALTGHPCPLCGGLRAVADLLHGNLLAALQSNALAVAILVGGAGVWLGWTRTTLARRRHRASAPDLTSPARARDRRRDGPVLRASLAPGAPGARSFLSGSVRH